jgi:hypothetical protein
LLLSFGRQVDPRIDKPFGSRPAMGEHSSTLNLLGKSGWICLPIRDECLADA